MKPPLKPKRSQKLRASMAKRRRPRKMALSQRLEQLLDRVTPENRHEETDWGEPRGKEVW
jgi:antitoxin component of MazEF toxin-antitoxin module